MSEPVYLDHAASTPLRPGVRKAMDPYLEGTYGNPSSGHRQGRAARKALEESREAIASALNCRPREVCFTSGGTEADNLAIFGAVGALPEGRRGLLTCATEHPAVLAPCTQRGATVLDPRSDGRLDPEAFSKALTPGIGLASVMAANNETGVLHPLEEIGRICRERKVLLHTDAVQAVGHIPVDWKTLPVDLLSLTAHKLGGPRGIGALIVREGIKLQPRFFGGDHEGGRRPGTENVAGAVGIAEALRLAVQGMAEEQARITSLRNQLLEGLRQAFPDLVLHGHPTDRLPQTLNATVPGVDATMALVALDQAGLAASGGSACHSGSPDPSPVLAAMEVPRELARGALRLSLGHSTTSGDIDRALSVLVEVLGRRRRKVPSIHRS
jgi:cysteine desulfurase